MTEAPNPSETADDDRRGIQSVEVGGRLLKAAARHGRPLPLKRLAAEAEMPAAKAHPYLVSYCKMGLMAQDPVSGFYGLGPLALELGLISLQQADPIRLATQVIEDLAQEVGHSVAIAVWGSLGPTIVRIASSPAPIHVSMRHGTVVSLSGTASGPLFAAHRPAAEIKALLNEERRRGAPALAGPHQAPPPAPPSWSLFSTLLDEVRQRGLSRTEGGVVAGVSAMAAPVFDSSGTMVVALTAIGPSGAFDARWEGPIAQALQRSGQSLTAQLGGRPPDSPPA